MAYERMSLRRMPMLMKGSTWLPKQKGGILLIQLGGIGDVVLTMPAILSLRRQFPDNELIACVREHAQELAEDCPWTDGVISVDKKNGRFARDSSITPSS